MGAKYDILFKDFYNFLISIQFGSVSVPVSPTENMTKMDVYSILLYYTQGQHLIFWGTKVLT